MGYFTYKKKCKQCGDDFEAARSDAKFCSQNCRKAHGRKRENANRDGGRLFLSMKQYMKLLEDDEVKEIALGWLMQIQSHLPGVSVTAAAVTDKSAEA